MGVGFIRQLRAFTLRVRMTGKPHPDRGIFRAGEHALCGLSLGNPLKQPPQNIGTRNNTSVSLGPEQDHVSINNAVLTILRLHHHFIEDALERQSRIIHYHRAVAVGRPMDSCAVALPSIQVLQSLFGAQALSTRVRVDGPFLQVLCDVSTTIGQGQIASMRHRAAIEARLRRA